jgi:hypothetical protein
LPSGRPAQDQFDAAGLIGSQQKAEPFFHPMTIRTSLRTSQTTTSLGG